MMYHRHIPELLACLLALIPIVVEAQQLTGYEYWFDGDDGSRVSKSLSGYEADIDVGIPTQHLSDGLHTLYLRVRQSDNMYSAVTSAVFFKHNASEGNKIEYWFDNNYESHAFMTLPEAATEGLVDITFNLQDNTLFPIGLHKLNLRVSTEGKSLNSIYSAWVLKLASGDADIIEYWVDEDFDNKKTVSGHLSASGNHDFVFVEPFDLSGLTVGLHRVYYRTASSNGISHSAVSMETVVVGGGETPTLEYWIDNDREHIGTLSGHEASSGNKGAIFNHTLNLGSISEGVHRLHYRGINSNGVTKTAISSTPIMVKSRYNIDHATAKMKAFTIAVDNEEPVTVNVNKDEELILNPYVLNVRDLNTGNHTLKAHFWNTANAGVALEQIFTVNAIETPSITLTAQENDGRVTLKFNSIPNDVKWGIVRTDANGVSVKIDGKSESCYPSEITSVDNPLPGSYKYKARGYYLDADGTRKAVNSNEVEVAVVASQNESFGKISGSIRNTNGNVIFGENWKVHFSDGVTIETDFAGSYFRDKIPVGTVLGITAQSRDFSCEPVTITVKEGMNLVFNEVTFDEELVRSRYASDLEFDSYVEFEPRLHMKFKVRNRTRLPWHGRLCIVTGRKDYVDNPPKNPLEQDDWTPGTQALAGSVAPFVVNECLQYDYSDELYLSADESKEVFITHHIPLISPPSYEDELYYFFVESIDEYGTKLVAVNEEYNVKENPLVQLVNNGQYDAERQGEEDVESCIALIMGICSTVTEFDGKLGDMSNCMTEMQQTLGYTLEYYLLADKIEHATNYSQILDDIPEWHFYHILFQEDRRFLGMVNSVRDKIAKEVKVCKNVLKYLKDVKKCIDAVKAYDQWQGMTDLERAGAIADKIMDLAEDKVPFAAILKTYLDVTKKTIHNINGLAEKWYANHDYDTFYNGQGTYVGSDFSFDINVKKKGWIPGSFDAEDVRNRIYSAEIKCIGHVPNVDNNRLECMATYTPEIVGGKLRLRRINITGDAPSSGGIVPIEDMWMKIRWSNGRVSYVPIRNSNEMKGNGVKHEANHYTITFQSATNDAEHMADIISLDD